MAYGAQNMGFAGAGIANCDEVAAAVQPITGSEGFDPGARQRWQGLEVEGGQGLASRKLRLGQMAADAAHVALCQFVFRQNGKEPGGGPAFGVSPRGDLLPELVEAGQAQCCQHAGQGVDVDLAGGHAAPPRRASKLSRDG